MKEYFNAVRKFNFWEGNVPQIGFLRESYLQRIQLFANNKLVKVIVGQRRTGKSYILRQIAQSFLNKGVKANQLFYLNKEYIAFDVIKDYVDLDKLIQFYRKELKPKGKIYLFLDEIQNIKGWERLVNSYSQDFTTEYEIYISGSNSNMLAGELATLLSGRYVSFEIFPFSYPEFLAINNFSSSRNNYLHYLQSGGLPELFILPNEETKRHYIASVKDTVLLRDIIQKNAIKDPKLLEDVFVFMINNASNLMSINNIANYLKSNGRKTTFDTVSNYIGFIEDTFLIHKAERFDIKGKETIAGNAKFYANDLSYKNYLYSGFGYGIGNLLENLIYLALKRSDFDVFVGVLPNKEVDFVAKKANQTIYVQSAFSIADENTNQREYASLQAIKDNYPKIVVSLDDFILPTNKGILHVQAWNFDKFLEEL